MFQNMNIYNQALYIKRYDFVFTKQIDRDKYCLI